MHIYYFSGTGNTKVIVDKLAESLHNSKKIESESKQRINKKSKRDNKDISRDKSYIETFKITLFNKDTVVKLPTTESDQINHRTVIVFPVNTHATSPFIWSFLKRLPKAKGEQLYIIYTYNNSAAIGKSIQRMVKRKGYDLRMLTGILMPNHMISDPEQAKDNESRLENGLKLCTEIVSDIKSGRTRIDYKTNGSKLLSFFNRNTPLVWGSMRLFFKLNVDHQACTNCGLCVEECPVKNIKVKKCKAKSMSENENTQRSIQSMLKHKGNCQMCMKCLANCPMKAVGIKGNDKISLVQ